MELTIVNEKMEVLSTVHVIVRNASRVPVKGDYVQFHITSGVQLKPLEVMATTQGLVEKVMIDYIRNLAIVTVKQS